MIQHFSFQVVADNIQAHGVLRYIVFSILSCTYSEVLKVQTELLVKVGNYINVYRAGEF